MRKVNRLIDRVVDSIVDKVFVPVLAILYLFKLYFFIVGLFFFVFAMMYDHTALASLFLMISLLVIILEGEEIEVE